MKNPPPFVQRKAMQIALAQIVDLFRLPMQLLRRQPFLGWQSNHDKAQATPGSAMKSKAHKFCLYRFFSF
jgi:hypothetical protein